MKNGRPGFPVECVTNDYKLFESNWVVKNILLFSFLKGLKIWIMRRLRSLTWKQWKNPRARARNLEKLGISHEDAMLCGYARKKLLANEQGQVGSHCHA
jgi:hypothetical protein